MKYISICQIGQVRRNNQDHYLINDMVFNKDRPLLKGELKTVCVFDGVGGANYGEVASYEAGQFFVNNNPFLLRNKEELTSLIMEANNHILNLSQKDPKYNKTATTIAGLHFNNNKLLVFNLGDSSVYRYRFGFLMQLTKTHTVAEKLRSDDPRLKNRIYQYLGDPNLKEEEIHIVEMDYQEDDIFLVSSDGITDYISIDDLDVMFDNINDIEKLKDAIEQKVNENGAGDNYTMILIKIKNI